MALGGVLMPRDSLWLLLCCCDDGTLVALSATCRALNAVAALDSVWDVRSGLRGTVQFDEAWRALRHQPGWRPLDASTGRSRARYVRRVLMERAKRADKEKGDS